MFSIFSRKANKEIFPFHLLKTDMHSHLIPGIDDGSPNIETSFNLINGLLELGYEKLITTPHIIQDMYPNTPTTIGDGFKLLKKNWKEKTPIPLQFAAEYLLDDSVQKLVSQKSEILKVSQKKILIEFSFVSEPMLLKETLFELQINGYQLILAHPERYSYYHRKLPFYEDLIDMGCDLQCNLLSFAGYYGNDVKAVAEYLVKNKMVSYLGTDLHHENHLNFLKTLPYSNALKTLMSNPIMNQEL
jgi:tyrosine-protein phosphatase YwqE